MNTRTLWIVNASFEDPGVLRLQGRALDDNHVTEFVTALKKTGKFANIAIERVDTGKSDNPNYRKVIIRTNPRLFRAAIKITF